MAEGGAIASILTVAGITALVIVLLYCLVLLSRRWKKIISDRLVTALKRRRRTTDAFRAEFGYSWDYVMVFKVYREDEPVSDRQCKFSMRYCLQRLAEGGMEVRLFYSLQRQEVFCKIRASLPRLQKHADLVNYMVPLDPDALRKVCKQGREGLWDPLKIPDVCEETHLDPYEFIYARYEFDGETQRTAASMIHLYKKWPRLQLAPDEIRRLGSLGIEYMEGGITRHITDNDRSVPSVDGSPVSERIARNPLYGSGDQDEGSVMEMSNIASNDGADPESGEEISRMVEARIFRGVDRLKLISMIVASKGPGGCGLDIRKLMKDGCILGFMPLHDMVELRALESQWLTFFGAPWNQPVDQIKDYFGEKIGLYFKWLGMYTSWLTVAAVLGLGFWINVAYDDNNPNTRSVPYFAGIMAIWSVLFLEHWKRTEKNTAMKWGTIGFEQTEVERPQFVGETIRSPVDGKPMLYYPREKRARQELVSSAVIYAFIGVVVAVIASIFALRIAINSTGAAVAGVELAGVIASVLLAIQIQVLNGIFQDVARKLNNKENHRTDTEYEDALIAKVYTFQFVNSFASLFYIGFVKPYIATIDACVNLSCMTELQTTLGTIFLMRVTIGNLTELGIPMVETMIKQRQKEKMVAACMQSAGVEDLRSVPEYSPDGVNLGEIVGKDQLESMEAKADVSEVETAFLMPAYDVMLGTFEDYAEMAIQYGYTTMFVAAFPLATVLSLVNNYVEIRVDAWKLCQLMRRAEPRSAEDIGTWQAILEITSVFAIFINSGLVAFTATNMTNYQFPMRVWTFILMSGGIFALRNFIAAVIPDTPPWVEIQTARQQYITGKVIDNIEDEDEDALNTKTTFEVPDFTVGATDIDPM